MFSAELWKTIFDVAAVILLFLTFAAGTGAFIFGNIVNKRQAAQLAEKDRQAASDSKDKDLKISDAKRAAEEAKERAAALEVEALTLRKELVLQGPRENLITGENRRKLVDALKPFSGQQVDVRRSTFPFMVNGKIVSITPIWDDTVGLAEALLRVVKDAGWLSPPSVLPWGIQETGVSVEITDAASASTRSAADALVRALHSISLSVSGPRVLPLGSNRFTRVGTVEQATPPLLGKDTILLGVLTHPK